MTLTLLSFTQTTAKISFDKLSHNFGEIPQGTPVKCTFTFTNTGKAPLVLSDVKASCGCTTPEWPQQPIMPGSSAKITAEYNAAADGSFDKTITVFSNAGEPVELKLTGKVYKISTVDESENGTELKF